MICSRCGTQNPESSKFCITCGNTLEVVQQQPPMQTTQNSYVQPNPVQNMQPNYATTPTSTNQNVTISDYFFIILAVLLKPFTALQEELNKFSQLKNSLVITFLVSIGMTIISLLKTVIQTVRVTSYWSNETKWVWENLKEINYIKAIGMNLLIYLGIIFVIAGIYYIGSLIVKKQLNFSRLLGISAVSTVPILLCFNLLSPLLTMIYPPLGMVITIIGLIYTIIIIYESMNNELALEKDAKFYFNLICLSILMVALYYLYMKVAVSTISGGLSDLLDMFS